MYQEFSQMDAMRGACSRDADIVRFLRVGDYVVKQSPENQ